MTPRTHSARVSHLILLLSLGIAACDDTEGPPLTSASAGTSGTAGTGGSSAAGHTGVSGTSGSSGGGASGASGGGASGASGGSASGASGGGASGASGGGPGGSSGSSGQAGSSSGAGEAGAAGSASGAAGNTSGAAGSASGAAGSASGAAGSAAGQGGGAGAPTAGGASGVSGTTGDGGDGGTAGVGDGGTSGIGGAGQSGNSGQGGAGAGGGTGGAAGSAAIVVDPLVGLSTTEAGGTATFTVVLTSPPTADVTIPLVSSDTTEGTVSPASLTFTPATWNVAQTVTVTGVDDFAVDGAIGYTVQLQPATSSDPAYGGLDAADVAVTNQDDDPALERIDVNSAGEPADDTSGSPFSVSKDGRLVVFVSSSTNLADSPSAPPNSTNVFARDRQAKITFLASLGDGGAPSFLDTLLPDLSPDGRFMVFFGHSSPYPAYQAFRRDLTTGELLVASVTPGGAMDEKGGEQNAGPSVSADGQFVVFGSDSIHFPGGDQGSFDRVYLKDMVSGELSCVSCSLPGVSSLAYSPRISRDGRFVVFRGGQAGQSGQPPYYEQVYRWDRVTLALDLVSVRTDGTPSTTQNPYMTPDISANGRYVSFSSEDPALSPDKAALVAAGVADGTHAHAYIRDMVTGTTTLVARTSAGVVENGSSTEAHLSADGRRLVFASSATNLIAGETAPDPGLYTYTFMKDLDTGRLELLSRSPSGLATLALYGTISGDGSTACFTSQDDLGIYCRPLP